MTSEPETALERLLAEAPHVRALARTLVAGDAEDVIQETWMLAAKHGGDGVEEPRSWLSRIARNVAHNLRRGRTRRRAHEGAAPPPPDVPSSAELAAREEQRRRLVAAVDRLPEHLRTVVVLRYLEGVPAQELAARLGVPSSTVWNRTRQALRQLRGWLDERHGSRAAWVAPLAVLLQDHAIPAASTATASSTTTSAATEGTAWSGLIGMTAKTKTIATAAILLTLAGLVLLWQQGPGNPSLAPAPAADGPVSAATATIEPDPERVAAAPNREEQASGPEPGSAVATTSPTTGRLVVEVTLARTEEPAAAVGMTLRKLGGSHRIGVRRLRTDRTGKAAFEGLAPARYYLQGERGNLGKVVTIVAGETTRIERVIPLGVRVRGRVVDAAGVPLVGALIEVSAFARTDVDPFLATTSDERGEFELRDLPTLVLVGARSHGYASSRLAFVRARPNNDVEIELELTKPGGTLVGTVLDPAGEPVPDAVVRAGAGRVSGHTATLHGAPPIAGFGRTDAKGQFEITGLAAGPQPVEVWATDLAPWRGECEIAANHTVAVRVDLAPGARLAGTAQNAAGQPAPRAEVEIGSASDFIRFTTRTDSTGAFEFSGLPSGELQVTAEHAEFGKATQNVVTTARATATCALELSRGLELYGEVVLGDGSRREDLVVAASADSWWHQARTDPSGKFIVPNCPETGTVSLRVMTRDHERLTVEGVDPRAGAVTLQLVAKAERNVQLRGRIVDENGNSVPNAMVSAVQVEDSGGATDHTDTDGAFAIGPITAGRFRIVVRAPGRPRFRSPEHELVAGEQRDLGQITLPALGTARLQLSGDATDVRFRAYALGPGATTTFESANGNWRSGPMAVDRYRLFVSGPRMAAQAIEFVIRPDQETTIRVDLPRGTPQEFVTDQRELLIHRDGQLIARQWIRDRATIALAPGSYQATVRDEPKLTREFVVGTSPGPAVELR
ncbi:MAG: sigma-70 family RNA polymerase sigma factor [bacterium]|nr:sigma-70 family RNA polymerase sigma factor [bacterium]